MYRTMAKNVNQLNTQVASMKASVASLSAAIGNSTINYTKLDNELVTDIPEIILTASRGEQVNILEYCKS